jgi:hypothetical protein
MENQQIQPRADQPRVTTESLKRGDAPAQLEYRNRGFENVSRSPSTRVYGRDVRG